MDVTLGGIAGLLAALVFLLLVGVLAIPLVKLGKVLDETRFLVRGVADQTVPLLSEVNRSVSSVNAELARVEAITASLQSVTGNLAAVSSLFAATVGGPVMKAAAFTYGLRRALGYRPHAERAGSVR